MTKPKHLILCCVFFFVFASVSSCKDQEKQAEPSQNNTCEDFKTGGFLYENKEQNVNTTITRTPTLQTEANNITGDITKGLITWLDACTYQLVYLESTSELAGNIIGKTLVVQIVNISGSSYTYTSKLKGSNYTSTGTITKIN